MLKKMKFPRAVYVAVRRGRSYKHREFIFNHMQGLTHNTGSYLGGRYTIDDRLPKGGIMIHTHKGSPLMYFNIRDL